jgi:hypothetical protein
MARVSWKSQQQELSKRTWAHESVTQGLAALHLHCRIVWTRNHRHQDVSDVRDCNRLALRHVDATTTHNHHSRRHTSQPGHQLPMQPQNNNTAAETTTKGDRPHLLTNSLVPLSANDKQRVWRLEFTVERPYKSTFDLLRCL